MRGAVENRGIGEGLPGGACQSLFPEPPQLFNRRDSLDARAGRRRGALGRIFGQTYAGVGEGAERSWQIPLRETHAARPPINARGWHLLIAVGPP